MEHYILTSEMKVDCSVWGHAHNAVKLHNYTVLKMIVQSNSYSQSCIDNNNSNNNNDL